MKERFLVVCDYGQGGVWAFVHSESRAEIEAPGSYDLPRGLLADMLQHHHASRS
jgi:hypothetical protein